MLQPEQPSGGQGLKVGRAGRHDTDPGTHRNGLYKTHTRKRAWEDKEPPTKGDDHATHLPVSAQSIYLRDFGVTKPSASRVQRTKDTQDVVSLT